MGLGKRIISIILAIAFVLLACILFIGSLESDHYVHFLKDSFVQNIKGDTDGLVGFRADARPVNQITSLYGGLPAVYYYIEHQRYVNHGKHSSWDTISVEDDTSDFHAMNNNASVRVLARDASFKPMESTIYNNNGHTRDIEYVIRSDIPVYVWGKIEGMALVSCNDTLIVTDSAKLFLEDNVSGLLTRQYLSSLAILLLCLILIGIHSISKERSYRIY